MQPSSRFGTPEELKALIDEAHRMGLVVGAMLQLGVGRCSCWVWGGAVAGRTMAYSKQVLG